MKRITRWLAVGAAVASAAWCFQARAGTAVFDFETNPTNQGITFFGNGEWRTSGGNPGGYLKVTDAAEGGLATMVFPDLDNGLVVKSFSFDVEVRIGGGSNPPADGFSVNYAREGDDVLDDGVGWAASPGGEANLPEEGTQTGLGIGFDEWDSGSGDVIGFSIRIDNELITQISLPTVNGALDDATSLQTGPINPDRDANDITTSWALLGWATLGIDMDQNGVLNITWKGVPVVEDLQTDFFPSPGRIVFGGRVGGSNANHHVDNITLTTVGAESFLVTGLKARPDGFRLKVNDGAAGIDTTTIVMAVNNEVVPASTYTVEKNGATTFITYSKFPETFPVGETVEIAMTASDTSGSDPVTETRTYVTPSYATVTPSDAVPAASVDTSTAAFGGHAHQIAIGRFPGDANNYWNAERQINDGYIDPATGQPYENIVNVNDPDGLLQGDAFYQEDLSINYSRLNPDTLQIEPNGNFRSNATIPAYIIEDGLPPGLPGLNADGSVGTSSDNCVYELLAYVDLPSGVYEFGVNSDDGFRVTAGLNARSIFAEEAGLFNGGRGSSDTLFWVVAQESGYYPIRLLWWNGGGGANCEFFQVMGDDSKQLIYGDFGDPNDAVTPYPSSSVKFNAAVVNTTPWEGQTGVLPIAPITAMLKDGSATVNASSIKVSLNGTDIPVTTTKIGDVTHATATPPDLLASGSTNTVVLEWAPTGQPVQTDTWQFVVVAYSPLPEWIARPVGSGTNPGMVATVNQMDVLAGWNGSVNRWHYRDQQAAGLLLPNVATVSGPQNIDLVNMNADGTGGVANPDVGIFSGDSDIPGIPGNVTADDKSNDIAMSVVTYLEFPAEGYYQMGVNSDDGFRVVAREALPRTALVVESPASIAGPIGAVSGGPESGAGAAALPRGTPLTGKVVMVDPPLADAELTNAAEIAGNIAMIDRGVVGYVDKILRAQAAGATGVIMVNKPTPEQGPLPVVMGGITGVTIPAVMIMDADGDKIKAQLANNVTVSIGLDGLATLGEFNDGRGQDGVGTRFGFYVPKAGVYPFRLIWFEGGGGANVEWFSVDANNTAILLNDPDNASSIKAYRNAPAVEEPTEIMFNAPIVNEDGTITLSWEGAGTLQETTVIPAEWSTSADQSNPQPVTPGSAAGGKYYRVMGQ